MKKDRMSRVARRKVEKKKRIVNWFKGLPIKLLKDIGYLLVGILYLIYLFLNKFDNLVSRLYKKLPRLVQVSIIYVLIGGCVFGIVKPSKTIVKVERVEVAVSQEQVEETQAELTTCKGNDKTTCDIYMTALDMGLSEEQSKLAVAISRWETGRYTSEAFKNYNNVGGMMNSNGLKKFDSLNEGIVAFLTNLKVNYFEKGLTTIESIQKKYAPIGASNDPNNKNSNWCKGVECMLNELSITIE